MPLNAPRYLTAKLSDHTPQAELGSNEQNSKTNTQLLTSERLGVKWALAHCKLLQNRIDDKLNENPIGIKIDWPVFDRNMLRDGTPVWSSTILTIVEYAEILEYILKEAGHKSPLDIYEVLKRKMPCPPDTQATYTPVPMSENRKRALDEVRDDRLKAILKLKNGLIDSADTVVKVVLPMIPDKEYISDDALSDALTTMWDNGVTAMTLESSELPDLWRAKVSSLIGHIKMVDLTSKGMERTKRLNSLSDAILEKMGTLCEATVSHSVILSIREDVKEFVELSKSVPKDWVFDK